MDYCPCLYSYVSKCCSPVSLPPKIWSKDTFYFNLRTGHFWWKYIPDYLLIVNLILVAIMGVESTQTPELRESGDWSSKFHSQSTAWTWSSKFTFLGLGPQNVKGGLDELQVLASPKILDYYYFNVRLTQYFPAPHWQWLTGLQWERVHQSKFFALQWLVSMSIAQYSIRILVPFITRPPLLSEDVLPQESLVAYSFTSCRFC